MHAIYRVTIIGCAGFLVLSCAGARQPRVGQTVTTGAAGPRMIMNDDAAMRLTNARCQRESTCDTLGGERRFRDPDACRRSLFPETQATVTPEACPSGVDEAKLALCVASVRNQPCGQQALSIEGSPSCRRSALCEAP